MRRLKGVLPLPTMLTIGNLLFGFGAISFVLKASAESTAAGVNSSLQWACYLVLLAMLCDLLDGSVARLTKAVSRFGGEMDSLADAVSFGVAPALIVKVLIDQPAVAFPVRYGWTLLAVYVACGALRLARFNVESSGSAKEYFHGLPIPAAAGALLGPVLFLVISPEHDSYRMIAAALPFLAVCLGILMVSRVAYDNVSSRLFAGRRSLRHIVIVLLLAVLIVLRHEIMIALVFNVYVIFGIIGDIVRRFRPERVKDGVRSVVSSRETAARKTMK